MINMVNLPAALLAVAILWALIAKGGLNTVRTVVALVGSVLILAVMLYWSGIWLLLAHVNLQIHIGGGH